VKRSELLYWSRQVATGSRIRWTRETGSCFPIAAYDRILIVATGPSIEGVPFPPMPGVYIIAVNKAIEWLPHADAFFSMDPDRHVLPLLLDRRPGVVYYVALPNRYPLIDLPDVTFLRRVYGEGPRGTCYGLAEDTSKIHAGNSAYGALGVAYHMRPKKIALVGLDATDIGHAYERRNPGWSLEHLPYLFSTAGQQLEAQGIEVVNGSPRSLVKCFHRVTPKRALSWVKS